jgi:hypothetical protein
MRPPILVPLIMSKWLGLRRRLGVDGGHELLEHHEQGQSPQASTVNGEQAKAVARHGT